MPSANSMTYAQLFQESLDEVMIQDITTGFMEAQASQVQYSGGNTVRIPKISMTGLGTYNRATGFPTSGAVTTEWETKTFTMDRGQQFQIDENDVDETKFVATAANVLRQFQRTKVGPEVDAYRFKTIFELANTALKTGNYIPVAATVFQQLKNDIAAVQDVVGESEQLVVCISMPTANILDQSDKLTHELSEMEFAVGNVSTKVKSIDGIPLIKIPSARFKSDYTFSATDGFSAAATAMNLNWVIMARRSVIAVVKTDGVRVFDPASNQNARAWLIDLRKYHDLWIPDNKMDGVYVSYYSTVAPALSATIAQGSASGTTKATITADSGNTLGYTLTATADPGYYNTIPTVTAYTSGADIAATAGQYLNLFELNAAGRIVKFVSHLLVSGDIAT